MRENIFWLSLASLFFVAGSPKTTVVLMDSGKDKNSIVVSNEKSKTSLDEIGAYVELTDKNKSASEVKMMSKEEINKRFSKALAIAAPKPMKYILYFQPNSKELDESSKLKLEEALKTIKERSPCMVDIIGHTDTTGSNAINIKVSLKRAKYIESLIRERKIKIVSLVSKGYGEEDLLIPTADDVEEVRNRNVEIYIK